MNFTNPFSDMFKNKIDFSQVMDTGRKNFETVTELSQGTVENVKAITQRQAELTRANVENAIKASKDIFTGGSPETNVAKQVEFAKATFENSLANMREVSEMIAKSCFEAFDVLNNRMSESMDEVTKASNSNSAPKKKSA